MRDFYDDAEVRAPFTILEAERFIAEATGAKPRLRLRPHGAAGESCRGERSAYRGTTAGSPATRVHVDHTAKSGPQRVRDLLPAEADQLLKSRVQIINLWRPILRSPARRAASPCDDAGSVAPEDLIPSDLVYRDRVGDLRRQFPIPSIAGSMCRRCSRTRCCYWKCFDSATDGRRALYAAFGVPKDPTAPADMAPRESIRNCGLWCFTPTSRDARLGTRRR